MVLCRILMGPPLLTEYTTMYTVLREEATSQTVFIHASLPAKFPHSYNLIYHPLRPQHFVQSHRRPSTSRIRTERFGTID